MGAEMAAGPTFKKKWGEDDVLTIHGYDYDTPTRWKNAGLYVYSAFAINDMYMADSGTCTMTSTCFAYFIWS